MWPAGSKRPLTEALTRDALTRRPRPPQVAERVMEHPKALLSTSSRIAKVLDRAVIARVVKSVGT